MPTSEYLEGSSPVGTPVEGGLQGPETTGVAAGETALSRSWEAQSDAKSSGQ